MNRTDRLRQVLTEALNPVRLEIADDSARHAGHAGNTGGGESHFNVVVVAEAFAGLSRVERQRLVYAALADEFAAGLHALSLKTMTVEEAG